MVFFGDMWDDITGETNKREARWRYEVRIGTTKTREQVVEKANQIWLKRNTVKIKRITEDTKNLCHAQDTIINLHNDISVHLKQSSNDKISSFKERDSDAVKINNCNQNALPLYKIIRNARVNYPYETSTIFYHAKDDNFIIKIDDFIRKELKGNRDLESEWALFHKEVMEIVI